MSDAGVQHHPQVLLGVLGDSDPEFAAGICGIMVDEPNGALAPYLQPLLSNVRIWDAGQARAISQRALGAGSNILCLGLASSFQSRRWVESATALDIEHIKMLLSHEDMYVRKLAIGSLGALAQARRGVAMDLAKNVELGDSDVLASELCRLFYGEWGLPFTELTADDLKVLLSKLEDVPDIDDHWINSFLVKASELDAVAVVGFLLNRIRKEHNGSSRYDALPILGFRDPLVGLATSPDHERILREIRDASLEQGRSVRYWIPQLFREISSSFESATSLQVLDEWINSGNANRIKAAARLTPGARPGFVFKHVGFVSNLLEGAYMASDGTYQAVGSTLASIALSGSRSGTPGLPMPEDVATKDQAEAIASTFNSGSPAYRFYFSLAESAEASIRFQLMRDEEQFEQRGTAPVNDS